MEQKNEKKDQKKKLQEKYAEIQLVNQQIQQIQEQLNNIWQQTQELAKLNESLIDIQKIKKGNKILVPLGASIFLEGNIEDTSKVLMGVGAGVCVKKDSKEAIAVVENQIKELTHIEEQLAQRVGHLISYARDLQKELTVLMKK